MAKDVANKRHLKKMNTIGFTRTHIPAGTPVPWSNSPLILDLQFVGSGGAFAERRGESNAVLCWQGRRCALDMGRQWIERSPRFAGTRARDIDELVITHCHSDHIGSVARYVEQRRYIDRTLPKPRLVAHPTVRERLFERTIAGQLNGHERGVTAADFFEVAPTEVIDGRRCRATILGGLPIELFRTMHEPSDAGGWGGSEPCVGIYIPAFKLWLSGDTRNDPRLVGEYVGRGAEWYIHEVGWRNEVHTSWDEVQQQNGTKRQTLLLHSPDDLVDSDVPGAGFLGLVEPGDLLRYEMSI